MQDIIAKRENLRRNHFTRHKYFLNYIFKDFSDPAYQYFIQIKKIILIC